MKANLWTIFIAVLLVAVIGGYANLTARRLTEEYGRETDAIIALVENGEMTAGYEKAAAMKIKWAKDSRTLQLIAHHEDLKRVDAHIQMLEAGFGSQDRGIALDALNGLEADFEAIYQREAITLENII